MKNIAEIAGRAHDKMPYLLQGSPVDPAVIVLVLPLLLGYAAVIVLANLV